MSKTFMNSAHDVDRVVADLRAQEFMDDDLSKVAGFLEGVARGLREQARVSVNLTTRERETLPIQLVERGFSRIGERIDSGEGTDILELDLSFTITKRGL